VEQKHYRRDSNPVCTVLYGVLLPSLNHQTCCRLCDGSRDAQTTACIRRPHNARPLHRKTDKINRALTAELSQPHVVSQLQQTSRSRRSRRGQQIWQSKPQDGEIREVGSPGAATRPGSGDVMDPHRSSLCSSPSRVTRLVFDRQLIPTPLDTQRGCRLVLWPGIRPALEGSHGPNARSIRALCPTLAYQGLEE
jgi:hypothetical protein